jgi:hypothetical protein
MPDNHTCLSIVPTYAIQSISEIGEVGNAMKSTTA